MAYGSDIERRPECAVERTVGIIGAKWTTLILRELLGGTKRFGELKSALAGISPKTLSDRLRTLEAQGIVTREVFPEVPPRVEYTLTPRGHSLGDIIAAMAKWGAQDRDNVARVD
ncbi:winged helix-turn-helix transcriptional regulator [Deinococcus yavapaiensis]|uniref:HxlR family transcriptional regulator n=1 Tax=Deinococcus yavapaiensis KR-236 TaxID=694435 RepID=A0A318SCW6_9DEIO|nr:helix-turn-helix domain-containing protein [Deinococcus yavapaiensis]PYE54731.1 HxlR family transcriptional regulator [Deinococcus yavapaiensis KR-236]